MTKKAALLRLLYTRWVTVQDSMRLAGVSSLSQRVTQWEREDGLAFERRWVTNGRSRYLAYRAVKF